jgi:hypothetical protein
VKRIQYGQSTAGGSKDRAGRRKPGEDGKNMRRFEHLLLSRASSDAFFPPALAADLGMVCRGTSA